MIKEFKFKLTKKQKDLCESICDPYTQKLPLFFGYTNTNDNGKIMPRRVTGTSAKMHRKVVGAIKRARTIGLMPFVDNGSEK